VFSAARVTAEDTVRIEASPFTEAERATFVKAHNDARSAVGEGVVEWSDALAEFPSEWLTAQRDAMTEKARQGQLPNPGHRPRDGKFAQKYGENIAIWGGSGRISADPAQAVTGWMKEKAAFDKLNAAKPYVVGDEQGRMDETGRPIIVGHYTQLIWNDTKRIGAARAIVDVLDDQGRMKQRSVVVICNYDPPGNVLGRSVK